MDDFAGRSVIVTGGAGGIGFEIAKQFLERGALVSICDISKAGLEDAASKLKSISESITDVKVDITITSEVETAASSIFKKNGRIDILVNCAGIILGELLESVREEDWKQMMDINVYGAWRFTVACLPYLRKVNDPSIINICSISSIKAFASLGTYCTSKAALKMMTEVFALELAPEKIRVNAVLPGLVENTNLFDGKMPLKDRDEYFKIRKGIHPLGRNATVEDIANVVCFLASEKSSYITGASINVDGGRHLATNKPEGI